jgi:hypothetical protein
MTPALRFGVIHERNFKFLRSLLKSKVATLGMGVSLKTAKRRACGETLQERGSKGGRRGFSGTSRIERAWSCPGRPPPASPTARSRARRCGAFVVSVLREPPMPEEHLLTGWSNHVTRSVPKPPKLHEPKKPAISSNYRNGKKENRSRCAKILQYWEKRFHILAEHCA